MVHSASSMMLEHVGRTYDTFGAAAQCCCEGEISAVKKGRVDRKVWQKLVITTYTYVRGSMYELTTSGDFLAASKAPNDIFFNETLRTPSDGYN